jgi:sterol desaturase/sphingolipid hydroxylase (fatty acid hydroxylase superfamily)
VFVTLLALFQHANVRLRFPVLRWVINTPEWHHWHHAIDDEARDKNFGLPLLDKAFGTAYLPKDVRPTGFGTHDPVPQDSYLGHLAYPFTKAARGGAGAPAIASSG